MAISLDVRWIHGSPDCVASADPPLQVHALDGDTFILRQSKCLSFEAPFLYLFFGTERAILFDTGAQPVAGRQLPLREVVSGLVAEWSAGNRRPADLVVAHTHGHEDHVFGDDQFAGQPRTTIVPPTLDGVGAFFGLADWPEGSAVFDLGGRPLTLIPTPGHEPSHVAVYDERTGILITGDVVYPGFLYVRDRAAYRASIDRLARFAATHPVTYLLGCHIEMTRTPGVAYPSGTTYQPEEHELQLLPRHLAELAAGLAVLGDRLVRKVFDDFIVEPVARS
ncbi:MAG TPA: MBL fold metallo-hydrolase [Thermoanaerobaculia bacterium]|nr:MBL fold metallo-hydrolase [Thermoanaerobaculia bacterium]